MQYEYEGITLKDDLVINPDDFIPAGEYNPHNKRPWLILGEYGPIAIAFADCEQDALDYAADADKLIGYLAEDQSDMTDRYSSCGNDCALYDLTYVQIRALPVPAYSWLAMFRAHIEDR